MIEDSAAGLEAARAAGALAIGVTTTLSRDALLAAGAHDVIDSITELPRVLPHLFP